MKREQQKTVAVVGLGYVGLPLALLAESKGFKVIGIEQNAKKLKALQNKIPVIDDETANKQLKNTSVNFTDDYMTITSTDIVIICVPTPVDHNKNPDLSPVKTATLAATQYMKKGSLLIIESTINPGVCDEIVVPLIESNTDHKIGETLFLAHCPERINPGDKTWHVGNINRVLGADSQAGLDLAYDFYINLVDAKVKKMGSLREAEAVKVVENSFRDINIAFVNELAMSFEKLGINVTNVIDGAATKPFGFMPFYPGIGVGGHCIPVDPYYLIEYARNNGFEHSFLRLARSINEAMPKFAVKLLEAKLKEHSDKTLNGAKVLVLGLAYKPDVGDDRESPAYEVISELEARSAKVTVFDPFINHKSSAPSLQQALVGKDAYVLVTGHSMYRNLPVSQLTKGSIFLDGRSFFSKNANTFKDFGVHYTTLDGEKNTK